jgi:hypothetical protein
MTLDAFQRAFWGDLWSAAPVEAWPPAFAVYRNTVRTGCVEALLSLYPAVRRLTGDVWMRAAALDHVHATPPANGALHRYGRGFPEWLAQALPVPTLPWLPAVAALDRAWHESHVAADAPVLRMADVAAVGAERLAHAQLVLHPAARWHWCADWPVYSLWQAARLPAAAGADPNPPHWHGEGALLARPGGAVQALPLDAGEHALLQACAAGRPLPQALDAGLEACPALDVGAALARLLRHGAFTSMMEITP